MNIFNTLYCRTLQFVLRSASKFIYIPKPIVLKNIFDIKKVLKENSLNHPLIISSKTVSKFDCFISLKNDLNENSIKTIVFNQVKPDPTVLLVNTLVKYYKDNNCDSIIAYGGGSVIDSAKAMGSVISSNKSINKIKGLLKIHKKLPLLIAIPTTAGTGSEATMAAVIINEKNDDKFALTSPYLVPKYTVLDNNNLIYLPQSIIANTGIDALSHALEAYLSRFDDKLSNEYALKAIKLIHDNLYDFYNDSSNSFARTNMQEASYLAGLAFTRVFVGYVHPLAHAVGGKYQLPHGYCIAIFMPYVLRAYGKKIYKKMEVVSDLLGFDKNLSKYEKTIKVINWIEEMNSNVKIPKTFDGLIKKSDVESLVKHSIKEAHPFYPVPKILTKSDLKHILDLANKKI